MAHNTNINETNPNNMKNLILFKRSKYSKWKLLDVYCFDGSWYVVQVRENLNTGYKQFNCKKFIKSRISYSNGLEQKNLTVELIENLFKN